MSSRYDTVVVGGGHNGLVAAAYLARAGLRTVVFEAREQVGGAAVTEQPFGPGYNVTTLSYVVGLLPQSLVHDLSLVRHGYHVYAQGPYFAPHSDGRYLAWPSDRPARHEQIAKFSDKDAIAVDRWDAWLDDLAAVLGPLLDSIPPRLGSRRPADLIAQARLLRRLRRIDTRRAVEVTRLFTLSISDLLEDFFESEAVKALLSVSGVIGTWAGPRSAGTAYVMAHHHIGDLGDGKAGVWGFPRGGMGAVTQAMAAAARSFGVEIRTSTSVSRITTSGDAVTGVVLDTGEVVSAATVVTTTHPALTFLRLVDRSALPPDFVADIERWRSRSGVVKVNLAVDRLPEFTAKPGFDPDVHGGTIVLAESLDEVEGSFQDAVSGRSSRRPFADTASRPSSTTPWRHTVTTSCRCSPSGCLTSGQRRRTAPRSRRTPTPWSGGSRRWRPASPAPCCTGRSSAHGTWRRSTAWSEATSSTASCRGPSCSTRDPPPATRTCGHPSAACTKPGRPPTAGAG